MKITAKIGRRIGLGLFILAVAFLVIRTWVVPALIVRQIQAEYRGKVVVRSWWLGLHSAGLVGVALHEGPGADSPEWLSAERISTDVSLTGLLHGRFMPTRITIDRPRIAIRVDAKNRVLTQIPLAPPAKSSKPPEMLPEIDVVDGSASVKQEGREELAIGKIAGSLKAGDRREVLDASTDDPTWGRLAISGDFDPTFQEGVVRLATGPGFVIDANKAARMPFVPTEVWTSLEPRGRVDARVTIAFKAKDPEPVHVHTELDLRGTSAKLETLGVAATDTTGRVRVDDARVTMENFEGKTLDGSIGAGGTLDFGQGVPRFDLAMTLDQIDVTRAPKSWQLDKVGADGRLSGAVDLKVALNPTGPDLTGTVGRAIIEGGSFQGIPIKSLSVTMRAEGQDLRYDTGMPGPGRPATAGGAEAPEDALWESLSEAVPLLTIWNGGKTVSGWIASEMRKQQPAPAPGSAKPSKAGITLPRTISTQIELEDVDLDTIIKKAEAFGIKIPVPVAGRFSLKANATIPIASPRDLKKYAFHGESSLTAASIDHIDFGRLDAKLDLIDGVLELTDFRGQFVDHPSGDHDHPPAATALPPREGELPVGGFRGGVRVEIAPRGRLTAKFEGRDLPLGELSAPALPNPNPLAGLLSISVDAGADVAKLGDPSAWTVAGHADSRRITYKGAVLDQIATRIRLEAGKLDVPELTARLAGHPLTIKGNVSLAAPYAFDGRINVDKWELADILAFVPSVPRPSPASGAIDAQGEANGTLSPFAIQTRGSARVLRARTPSGPLGNVVLQWKTDRDTIAITGLEAQTFGGRITAEARIPTMPGSPLDASARFKGVDTARLASTFLGDALKMTGTADGRIELVMPLDASSIKADVLIDAPDLTVHGIPAQSARVTVKGQQEKLDFEVTADSLGGKIRFNGSAPVGGDRSKPTVNAELQVAGFQMLALWQGLGMTGEITKLDGLAAVVLNLRASLRPFAYWARGAFEIRDLHLESPRVPIGGLRGNLTKTPTSWRVDDVRGELLGGAATGEATGDFRPDGSPRANFDFRLDRASLARMMLAVPSLASAASGVGSVHVNGRLDGMLQANAEATVPHAKLFNLPMNDLRFPGEINWNPATGTGSFHARHWTSRLAGGSLRGTALLRLGSERSFQIETQASDLDIELLSRVESDSNKAASGKLSGRLVLNGADPAKLSGYRGKIDIDLADASLVEVPVFKDLIRFASVAGGGLFEVGHLHGSIMNQTVNVDEFTLDGRVIQIHATGTVTFSGGLNLEVLVNTNRIIPEKGQALIRVIPGLGEAVGRSQDAIMKVASFLSNRLLKFRVSGTVKNPTVSIDAGVAVTDSAVGFFSSVLRLPVGGSR